MPHVPTPWKVHQDGKIIRSESGIDIAAVRVTPPEGADRLANAEFIVRAVNSHEQLVAACQEALARMPNWEAKAREEYDDATFDNWFSKNKDAQVRRRLVAALTAAKE